MAIKRSLTDQINLTVQIITALLTALMVSGLKIDPAATAAEIYEAIKAQSLPGILSVLFNFGTMVYLWVRTWKTDRPNFWSFWTSRSWLISVANVVIPGLAIVGVVLPYETAIKLIDQGLSGDWQAFSGTLILTIIGIIGSLLKPKLAKKVPIDSESYNRKRDKIAA